MPKCVRRSWNSNFVNAIFSACKDAESAPLATPRQRRVLESRRRHVVVLESSCNAPAPRKHPTVCIAQSYSDTFVLKQEVCGPETRAESLLRWYIYQMLGRGLGWTRYFTSPFEL